MSRALLLAACVAALSAILIAACDAHLVEGCVAGPCTSGTGGAGGGTGGADACPGSGCDGG